MMEWQFDISIIEFLNQIVQDGNPGYKIYQLLFNGITQFGSEIIIILLFAIVYYCINKNIAKEVGKTAYFGMAFNNSLKCCFNRLRPFQVSDNVQIKDTSILIEQEGSGHFIGKTEYKIMENGRFASSSSSFPSGHSNGASSVYNSFAMSIKKRWAWIVATILCVLVMISRMVLGAHFLTDVICGYISGFGFCALIYYLRTKFKNEYNLYWILLAIFGVFTIISPFIEGSAPKDLFVTYGVSFAMILGNLFEEKFVNFNDCKKFKPALFRILIGVVIIAILYIGPKLLLKLVNLESDSYLYYVISFVRYFTLTFVAVGIYPIMIKKCKFLND